MGLAKGLAPYAKYSPMKVLLLTIQQPPPSLESYHDGDDINMVRYKFNAYQYIQFLAAIAEPDSYELLCKFSFP